MDIDAAVFRHGQDLCGKNLSIGSHYDNIRLFLAQSLYRLRCLDPLRLKNRNIMRQSTLLYGRHGHFPASSLHSVRLCHHQRHLLPIRHQGFQHRHRKVRRSHEYNFHTYLCFISF